MPLGDAAVGVGQAGVSREAGGGEGAERGSGDVGLGEIAGHEPLAPEVGGVVRGSAAVGKQNDEAGANLFAGEEDGVEAEVGVGADGGGITMGGEERLPGAGPAEGDEGAAVAVAEVEVGEDDVGGPAVCGAEVLVGLEEVLLVGGVVVGVVAKAGA